MSAALRTPARAPGEKRGAYVRRLIAAGFSDAEIRAAEPKAKIRRPAPVAPTVVALPKRMRVSPEALGRSRLAPRGRGVTVTEGPSEAFRVLPPPRGVAPDGVRPMALDEDLGAWAHGQSSWTENLGWLGMPFLAELAQRAEYRQIVETLAKEMTRRWIKVTAAGDNDKTDRVAQIEDALKKYRIRQAFRRLAELDGFFGRGHLYIDNGFTEDRDILKVPLILDRRTFEPGSLRGFRVVEPTWTYPGTYDSIDPLAEDYYSPRTWYVMGKEVHRTRLLTLVSREVPDLLKPSYQFGGVSMSQLARPYVDNWLRTRQSISDLVHSFSTMILETDMSEVLQEGGAQALFDRIELFNNLRDNRATMALDKDREALSNVVTPLGTLDHLQAQAQEQMASVSHTPLIILLGITPSGLNASSDGELQTWAAWVKSMQEHLFDDPLDRVIKCIQIDRWGEVDPDIGFDYEPIRELSDAERSAARKQDADTHAVYVDAGVIGPDEVRQSLAEDEESPYAGVDLSGPPPEPPQAEPDPLGGPPGSDPAAGPPGAPGDARDAPVDLAGGVAAAIEARRADAAYEHWWHRHAEDADFEEGEHPRDKSGKFAKTAGGASAGQSYHQEKGAESASHPDKAVAHHHKLAGAQYAKAQEALLAGETEKAGKHFSNAAWYANKAKGLYNKGAASIKTQEPLAAELVKAPAATELPEPYAGSSAQVAMHGIASDPETTLNHKIEQIAGNQHVQTYQNGESAKYAKKLLSALDLPDATIAKLIGKYAGKSPAPKVESLPAASSSDVSKAPPAKHDRGTKLLAEAKRFGSTHAAGASAAVPTLAGKFWDTAPHSARAAVQGYTDGTYSAINGALRKAEFGQSDVTKAINDIDELFEHDDARLKEDVVMYRGEDIPADTLDLLEKHLKAGAPCRYKKDGFISTSMANKPAFGKTTTFEIVARKGTPALGVATVSSHKGENEVLLRHGQVFEVFEIERKSSEGARIRMYTT